MSLGLSLNLVTCTLLFCITLLAWLQPNKALVRKYSKTGIYIAITCLTVVLLERWIVSGHIPVSNLYESCLFLSWIILLSALSIQENDWSLLVSTPIALLLQIFATFSLTISTNISNTLVPALQSNWLIMHVTMMIASYGFLIIGAILAIVWLVIDSKVYSLAWLENNCFMTRRVYLLTHIDYWSYRLIGLGFPLLTIGILSGAVWANEAWGTYWSWDPKETWALVTWIMFAIYLHTRLNNTGIIQPAMIASFSLGVIWMCYLGVNLLGQGLHSYGWFVG